MCELGSVKKIMCIPRCTEKTLEVPYPDKDRSKCYALIFNYYKGFGNDRRPHVLEVQEIVEVIDA